MVKLAGQETSSAVSAPPPHPHQHRRIAFAAFGLDKAKARRGQYRIAESTLLLFALLGGTLGAYGGRKAFRHKTRKQPFNLHLFQIAVLQMLVLGGLIGWWLRW